MKNENADKSTFESQFKLSSISDLLPYNYLSVIQSKLDNKVSTRTISYVLNCERSDNYGIIEIALDMAFQEKTRRAAILKRMQKLK
jgi:hypothetical protein